MDQKHAKEFKDVLPPDELAFVAAMNSGKVPNYQKDASPGAVSVDNYKPNQR